MLFDAFCSSSGSWRLGTGHWALETGNWPLGTGDWALETGNWALDTGIWKPETGNWDLDTENSKLETGNWTLDTENWNLETGHWALETGNWTLGPGNWRLGSSQSLGRSEFCVAVASCANLPSLSCGLLAGRGFGARSLRSLCDGVRSRLVDRSSVFTSLNSGIPFVYEPGHACHLLGKLNKPKEKPRTSTISKLTR